MPALAPPLRVRIALAYGTFILAGLGVGVAGVLLPAQIADYGVDRATIGITFFAFSAGFMLAGSSTGALIERFGIRAALLVGAGAFLLAGLYTATRPPFLALLVAQAATGFGIGLLESVLNAYLAELPRATTLLNRLHAFFGVGALLGPLLATRLLEVGPWTVVWLVLALATVPLLIGFRIAYPGPVPREPARASASETAVPGPRRPRGGLLVVALRDRGVLLGAVLLAVYVGLEIGVGNWAFSYLVEERGQADLIAGYAISGYWLGLTVGRFVISPVLGRLGLTAVGMTYVCLGGVTVTAVLSWWVPAAGLANLGLVLLGFFLGPIFPTTMAVVPRLTEARLVPTAIGVMNAGSVVGGSALPWLAGVLAQGVGLWTLLPFAAALALMQVAVWWRMAGRMRPPRSVEGTAAGEAEIAPPPA